MTQLPTPITEFSQYMFVVKGRLPRTVEQYEIDLMLFFKYLKATRQGLPLTGEDFDSMTIAVISRPIVSLTLSISMFKSPNACLQAIENACDRIWDKTSFASAPLRP